MPTVSSVRLTLSWLEGAYAVCRLDPGAPAPEWAQGGDFCASIRTPKELCLVLAQDQAPVGVEAEKDWRGLKVAGPLDFSSTGVLSSLTGPLAEAGISVFVLSTYETDYLFVKAKDAARAARTLHRAGHRLWPAERGAA